jgi:GDP-L-fucose synthase
MDHLKSKSIYVAGHRGMVGKALVRALLAAGADRLILKTRSELDLCNQAAVNLFFQTESPDVVIFAAGKVGGINSNRTYPANFIYDNLIMAANSIQAAYDNGVSRFLFLGSTCIYPRMAPQPMPESCLLTGPLETTNEAYAIAKIAGLKMCQHFRAQYGVTYHSAMPTNLYGPGDNYHPENSHVLPALLRRFHEAKLAGAEQVTLWGTGMPRREFLHVDDLADGILHLCQLEDPPQLVNIGTGSDIMILELAKKIAQVVGFEGKIVTDPSQPDGTPIKRTDMSLMNSTGWQAKINLDEGLKATYQEFMAEMDSGTVRAS